MSEAGLKVSIAAPGATCVYFFVDDLLSVDSSPAESDPNVLVALARPDGFPELLVVWVRVSFPVCVWLLERGLSVPPRLVKSRRLEYAPGAFRSLLSEL